MANRLTKLNNTTFTPGNPGMPGNPGRPYLPARCVETTYDALEPSSYPDGYVLIPASPDDPPGVYAGSVAVYGPDPDNPGSTILLGYAIPPLGGTGYRRVTRVTTVCFPEQTYIPPSDPIQAVQSQLLVDMQLGWNGGARSIGVLPDSGRMVFDAGISIVGAAVGFNDVDVDAGFAAMEHAWYLSGGVARVYESGAQVAYAGAYAAGDTFAIERVSGAVRYLHNDTLKHTSSVPSTGAVFMDVSLYSAGDEVLNPAIIEYAGSGTSMRLPPLTVLGMETAFDGFAALSFAPLVSSTRTPSGVRASMAALDLLGADRIYGDASTSLRPLSLFAQGGMPLPAYAIANIPLSPLVGGGAGMTGTIGGAGLSMTAMDALASEGSYGEASVALVPLRLRANAYEGNLTASMVNILAIHDHWFYPFALFVAWDEALQLATVMAIDRLVDAQADSEVTVEDAQTLEWALGAVMNAFVQVGFATPAYGGDSHVWVVDDSGRSSRYEGYPFNSFGEMDGRYYGVKEDGLYLLEGDTDDGAPIQASVGFGNFDFGTSLTKGMHACYLGAATDGSLYLKVVANDKEYLYRTRNRATYMASQRVDIGKGLRANFYTFELFNRDGGDFELGNIEFVPIPLSRRI